MALSTRHWILAAGIGCALIAIAYLPPSVPASWTRVLRRRDQAPVADASRRATEHLRTNVEHWIVLSERDSLLPPGRQGAPAKAGEVSVVFRELVSRGIERRIDSVAQSVWRLAQGPASALTFRLVVYPGHREAVTGPDDLGSAINRGYTLLPQVTDGRTCLVVSPWIQLSDSSWSKSWQKAETRRLIEQAVAPCALYIAFGRPGAEVERWLSARNFQLATDLSWAVGGNPGRNYFWDERYQEYLESHQGFSPVLARLAGELPPSYELPTGGTACVSGDLNACRFAAMDTALDDRWRGSWPRGTMSRRMGEANFDPHFGALGSSFVSDLIRDLGRERFAQFWRSDLPVEGAFQQAFGLSVAEWTQRWLVLRVGGTAVEAGVPIHLGTTLVGFLSAALLVGAATMGARKRQVG